VVVVIVNHAQFFSTLRDGPGRTRSLKREKIFLVKV